LTVGTVGITVAYTAAADWAFNVTFER